MHLDLVVAHRKAAEAAFFDDQEAPEGDDIPRISLEGFSEFELAHLAILLTGQFEPRLALDGDYPEDIVSEADPALTPALAALTDLDAVPLLARWHAALGGEGATTPDPARLATALDTLRELASLAIARRHVLLYTQSLDEHILDPDLD